MSNPELTPDGFNTSELLALDPADIEDDYLLYAFAKHAKFRLEQMREALAEIQSLSMKTSIPMDHRLDEIYVIAKQGTTHA